MVEREKRGEEEEKKRKRKRKTQGFTGNIYICVSEWVSEYR